MQTLGTAYLPAVLLVLAGSLTPTQDPAEQALEDAKSPEVKKSESRAFFTQIASIYVSRVEKIHSSYKTTSLTPFVPFHPALPHRLRATL